MKANFLTEGLSLSRRVFLRPYWATYSNEEASDVPLVVKLKQNNSKAAASEVISTLHDAKQEVAQELEANLKQLKSVLEDTQRIAKDMESVLREAKNEPSAQQRSQGNSEQSGQQDSVKKQGKSPQDTNKSANSKQSDSQPKEADQQDGKQQAAQGDDKSAGSKQGKQDRKIQVKVVKDQTYVGARPKAWVPPPYRTVPTSKAGDWEPPSEAEDHYF